MPFKDNRFARATDSVVTFMAYIAGVVLMLLMFITTADVVGRYFFNEPLTGVFDLTRSGAADAPHPDLHDGADPLHLRRAADRAGIALRLPIHVLTPIQMRIDMH